MAEEIEHDTVEITTDTSSHHKHTPKQEVSYGQKVGQKALRGLSNTTLGFLEIPKNVIRVTNKSNLLYGLTGGMFLGLVNTLGRTAVGISDLALIFLLPTKPIAEPAHPWENYLETDTNYNQIYDMDLN